MKRFTLKACCTLMLLASCFIFSSSNAQQLKILGKPYAEAYGFAGIIAQTIKLNAPDSANTEFNRRGMQVTLKGGDSAAGPVIIEFIKGEANPDIIDGVSITGRIPAIIELYAALYDKKVKAVKPEEVYTSIVRDGEVIGVRTDIQPDLIGTDGFLGRIWIRKK